MYTAPEGRCVLCLGPNCWGKGPTKPAANREARKHLPEWIRRPHVFHYYDAPADVRVDDMGYIVWKDAKQEIHRLT